MVTLLSNLANINPKETVEYSKSKWKPLYAILCGICSEYTINELKVNDDDLIYHQICSYYKDGDISSKKLLEQFKIMGDLNPLLANIDLNDTSVENYDKITNMIKWESDDECNYYTIDDFSFTAPHSFLIQHSYGGKIYCLSYTENDETPKYASIHCDHDDYNYKQDAEVLFDKKEDSKPSSLKRESMDDETFFNLTNELRTSDSDQRKAIKAGIDKNLLIIAGAGSGKTRSLVGRLTYLHLVKQIPISRIILLSYTNAATNSMKMAAMKQLDAAYMKYEANSNSKPYINGSTIDAFFRRIIDDEWAEIGFARKPDFYFDPENEDYRHDMLQKVLKENHMLDLITAKRDIKTLYKSVLNHAKDIYVNIPGIDSVLSLLVEKQIEECSVIDFDFTGCIINKVLERNGNELFRKICNRFDCILIDEFQDVNSIQNKVLSHFYDTNIHFTFVGDDDQSIYKFNGSDNGIIKRMREDGSCLVVPLTVNYRSNPNVVNAGNDILKMIPGRSKNDITIKPHKQHGSRIHISKCGSDYRDLAHEVERVYYAGDNDDTICILCRGFKERRTRMGREESDGQKIKRALELEHIPVIDDSNEDDELSDGYKILKSLLFIFNKNMVKSNLDYLIEYTNGDISSIELYNLLLGNTNNDISDYSDNLLLYQVLKLSESVNERTGFAKDFTSLISNYCRAYSEIIEENSNPDRFVSDKILYSFFKYAEGYDWGYPVNKDLLESIFYKFEETVNKKTGEKSKTKKKSVVLKTIHSAKGLEYNTVFVAGLNQGEYPNTSFIDWKYRKIEEELVELEKSRGYLAELRSTINDDTINELLLDCKTNENMLPKISDSFSRMSVEIENNRADIRRLNGDGIESFTDAFFQYISSHEHEYKDLIKTKDQERRSLMDKSALIEEQIYGGNLSANEYDEHISSINELKDSIAKIEKEISDLIEQLMDYKKRFSHLYNFNIKCIQADGYMRQNDLINDKKAILKRLDSDKNDEINEERRLFYVAVSRAIDNLYLCYDRTKLPSEFISMINRDYCDEYEMKTRPEDEETKRLRPFIDNARKVIENEEPVGEKADDAINAIVSNSNIDYLVNYLKTYLDNNPQFNNLPYKASVYFYKAIQMMGLSERLGVNLRIEIMFNLERFIHLYLSYCVGDKVEFLETDLESSESIGKDIRTILKNNCKIERIPSISYFRELFTLPPKYDKLSKCKNLVFESYVICSDIYDVSNEIIQTWEIEKIKSPEKYMCAAIDLINMRNEMVHSDDDPWATDYLPYAFTCIKTIMDNIQCKDNNKINKRNGAKDFKKDGFSASDLKYIGFSFGELKDAGFTVGELKDAGFVIKDFKDSGFTATELKEVGYNVRDLLSIDYNIGCLKDAGFNIEDFVDAGCKIDDLKNYYCAIELKNVGYSLSDMKYSGCSVAELKEAGYGYGELIDVGFTVKTLIENGYPKDELKQYALSNIDFKQHNYTIKELRDYGFSIEDVRKSGLYPNYSIKEFKTAGYSAEEMREAGYTLRQMKELYYSAKSLKEAGYSAKELKEAGYDKSFVLRGGYSEEEIKEIYGDK